MRLWILHQGLRGAGLVLVAGLLAVTACRSTDQLGADFDAYVEENASCQSADACAVIFTECPLGCFHAVRTDRVEQVRQRADELVAEYEMWGQACAYDCVMAGEPSCQDGLCHVESLEPGVDAGIEDGG
ncbi:MAG: hypothetical protein ABIJ09_11435 [Pseudomonadota bacterium]